MSVAVQNRRVLVLNKSWNPVAIVGMDRAMGLLFSHYEKTGEPKAHILDVSQDYRTYTWADWSALRPKGDEPVIRSATQEFKIPEVILLTRYNKLPQQKLSFSRRTIYRRDNNQCQYCGCRPGTEELTIDHVLPRAQGGQTTWENCVLACVACNSFKANRTPEQCGLKLKRKPTRPKFQLFRGEYRVKSWEAFLGVAYWETELENDMH